MFNIRTIKTRACSQAHTLRDTYAHTLRDTYAHIHMHTQEFSHVRQEQNGSKEVQADTEI